MREPRSIRSFTNLLFCALMIMGTRVLPLPVFFRLPEARADDTIQKEAERIQNLVSLRLGSGVPLGDGTTLNGKRLSVSVKALPMDKYAIALTGILKRTDEKAAVHDFVAKLKIPNTEIDDTNVGVEQSLPDLADQVVNLFKITLSSRTVPPPDAPFQFQVLPLPDKKYVVVLTGTYSEEAHANSDKAIALANRVPLPANFRLNVDGLVSKPKAKPSLPEKEPTDLVRSFMKDPNVAVNAVKTGEGKFTVVLTNQDPQRQLPSAEVDAAVKAAQAAQSDKLTILSQLQAYTPIARVHTLRFLRDNLPDVQGKNQGSNADISSIGADAAATKLATFLNGLYPGSTTVTDNENHLVLKGDPEQVQRLRQMLALYLDVPSSQVRADVWTIQINSRSARPHSREQAMQKMEEIHAGIQIVRDFIQGSQVAIAQYLGAQNPQIQANLAQSVASGGQQVKLGELLKEAGFDTNPSRPLSSTELLLFMTFTDRNQLIAQLKPDGTNNLAGQFKFSLERVKNNLQGDQLPRKETVPIDYGPGYPGILTSQSDLTRSAPVWSHRQSLTKLVEKMLRQINQDQANGRYLLDRVAKLYKPDFEASDRAGLGNFLLAWRDCARTFLSPPSDYNPTNIETNLLPGQLSTRSAATDIMLKQAMDALTADMQELFMQPLLDWIRQDVQRNDAEGSGVDLVGTTSLIVRDRALAETKGTAESYTRFTPIPKFGEDLLTSAKTLANGTAPTADQTQQTVARDKDGNVLKDSKGDPVLLSNGQALAFDKSGNVVKHANGDPVLISVLKTGLASTALGPLTPIEALGLKALFASDANPVFRSVAPGTSLAVRPFVLPDGGSARVQMNLVTTVGAQQPDAGKAAQQGLPVDLISSQSVVTEATISAFDLVEVSTFGAQTTRPGDYQWRIPILDSLPLIGSLFHGPQSRETHRQESIAIVNLTILPRSLDLVPFYFGGSK